MSSEWPKHKIEQIADVKSGKRLPLDHVLVDKSTPFPYIRLVDISDGKIQKNNLRFLTAETRSSIRRYVVNTGDVGLAIVGNTIGMVFYVDAEFDDVNLTENAARITNVHSSVNAKYLYYYLTSPIGQAEILSRKIGSAQGKLPLYNIRSLEVPVPPRADQDAMVAILDALSARINLLRETNATLEAVAQALFKSWFVDFDPVRAKQKGREPEGMDAETSVLFPSEFTRTEQSSIPKGWRHSSVGEAFVLTMGQSPPGDTYNEKGDGLPFYQGKTDFGFRFPVQRIFCNAPTRIAAAGDTLVSVRAPVGDVNMAIAKCCLGRGVAGVRHPEGHASFVFYSLQALRARFQSYNSEGTVFGSINKKDFQELPLVLPSESVLGRFTDIAKPIDERIRENEMQLRGLTDLRDALLPRLISGQLRLSIAEEKFNEALTGT